MNYKEYMSRVGVSKRIYIEKWLENDLIPGVTGKENIETAFFPESARRPYADKWLTANTDANKIRAHVVKAAIQRRHISARQCFMSDMEFSNMIKELVDADLIRIRVEDEIEYYDSTLKSKELEDIHLDVVRKFVLDAIEAATKGAASAAIEKLIA